MDRLTTNWRDLLALAGALGVVIGASIVWNIGVGLIVAGLLAITVAVAAALLLPRKGTS